MRLHDKTYKRHIVKINIPILLQREISDSNFLYLIEKQQKKKRVQFGLMKEE